MLSIIGKKLELVYETGWQYKIYYENDHHVQYHVVTGPAGGRFADQEAMYAQVAPGVFNIVWYEETGTVVSQVVNLNARIIYGFIAFPQWVWKDTAKTHGRKHEKLSELLALREQGPDAPRKLAYMTGKIIGIEELGENQPNVF